MLFPVYLTAFNYGLSAEVKISSTIRVFANDEFEKMKETGL